MHLLLLLAALTAGAIGAFILTAASDEQPPPNHAPGVVLQDFYHPSATPWASLLTDDRVENPPGAVIPFTAPTHTPTPTPTPSPTATPQPTWTPIPYVPPPTEVPAAYEPPAPSGSDWQSIVCSYGWSCSEALNVIAHESGGNPQAVNPSSGACGLWQLYPCPPGGFDVATATALAWAKYVDGGYSFYAHWYRWW